MELSKLKFWGLLFASFVLGWGLSYFTHTKTVSIEDKYPTEQHHNSTLSSSNVDYNISQKIDAKSVPPYVLETLEYVLEHKEAPNGYVGGRTFQNRERLLPKTDNNGQKLSYQEWDVHPKEEGKNRGAERLITSSQGEAYYTNDHYRSFTKIK